MAEYRLIEANMEGNSNAGSRKAANSLSPAGEAFRISGRKNTNRGTTNGLPESASGKTGTSSGNINAGVKTPAFPAPASTAGSNSCDGADVLDFSMEPKDLVKSLILSEVLGRPKSMRKARW